MNECKRGRVLQDISPSAYTVAYSAAAPPSLACQSDLEKSNRQFFGRPLNEYYCAVGGKAGLSSPGYRLKLSYHSLLLQQQQTHKAPSKNYKNKQVYNIQSRNLLSQLL